MKKKTLLQVRYGYPGLMITCNEYLQAFNNSEYKKIVVFLVGREDPDVVSQVPADKVIFLRLKKNSIKGLAIAPVSKLLKICRDNHVDIVFAHRYKPARIMAIAALFYKPVLMVSIVHRIGQFKTRSRRLIGKLLLNRYFKYIGVSEATRKDILDSGIGNSPDEVLGLGNCVDVDAMANGLLTRNQAREQLSLNKESYVIGTIARLSRSKDYPTLIRSFAIVRRSIPKSRLVIVGEGHLKPEIEALAQSLELGDSVFFAGRIDDGWRIIPAFDIFALTSQTEPFGRVLLEAMIARVPIVATTTGGIPEVVGEDYSLCPPGDTAEIAKGIITLYNLSDQERTELTEKMFQRGKQYFDRPAFQERLCGFVSSFF